MTITPIEQLATPPEARSASRQVTHPGDHRREEPSLANTVATPADGPHHHGAIPRPTAPAGANSSKRAVLLVVVGGLLFQAFHFSEHGAQLGHWLMDRGGPPWMSRWAMWGRDTLANLFDTSPAVGMELLHLVGNLIFFVALIGALSVVARAAPARSGFVQARRWQMLHLAEHVALTATVVAIGRPIGLTTGFGLWDASADVGVAVRVCTHFVLNLVPTAFATTAVVALVTRRGPSLGLSRSSTA